MMNFVGFYFYLSYNIYGYYYPEASYHKETHFEDVLFAAHAMLFVSINIVQYTYYPRGNNKLRPSWVAFVISVVAMVLIVAFALDNNGDTFYWMGLGKVMITFVKYLPQVW